MRGNSKWHTVDANEDRWIQREEPTLRYEVQRLDCRFQQAQFSGTATTTTVSKVSELSIVWTTRERGVNVEWFGLFQLAMRFIKGCGGADWQGKEKLLWYSGRKNGNTPTKIHTCDEICEPHETEIETLQNKAQNYGSSKANQVTYLNPAPNFGDDNFSESRLYRSFVGFHDE